MQRLGDGSWVISASDLAVFASCPWRLGRSVDEKLGKGVSVPALHDPMMDLVARLGLEHEARELSKLKTEMSVLELSYDPHDPRDAPEWRATIESALDETLDALASPIGAIFQATLYEERLPDAPLPIGFQGFADFIVQSEGVWEVWDSKLARKAKDQALIQLAAYVDQLQRRGIPVASTVRVILGDGKHSIHPVDGLLAPYREMRSQVMGVIAHRSADPNPLAWGDDTYAPCGSKGCPACSEQIVSQDDLFQVAGIKKTQREKIMVGGFATLEAFAHASRDTVRESVSGIGLDTLAGLHHQASLQVATREHPESGPAWEILSRRMLENVPPPSLGDIFFDFEGDPTYQEGPGESATAPRVSPDDSTVDFGIEYLFGMWADTINPSGANTSFLPLWAETFAQEKRVFQEFLDLVEARIEQFPNMHVYHYAPYERTRLKAMARRHAIDSPVLSELLNTRLIDLFPVVKKGLVVGLPSYSLKSLEALYFSPETRTGIAGGSESVVAFADYLMACSEGETQLAADIKDSILHYNRIDCFSTQALRDWMLTTALGAPGQPARSTP